MPPPGVPARLVLHRGQFVLYPKGKRLLTHRRARWAWWTVELFDGNGHCTWLKRWTLFSWRGWELYLHHWLHDDWSQHHHDHSRAMLSIGLWGAYTEHVLGQPAQRWHAPWARGFPATHRHYITLDTKTVWTLVLAWPQSHHSGFYVDGVRVGVQAYLRSPEATQQKRC